VEREPVFSYIDDATSDTYPLMQKLRAVLVSHALKITTSSKGEKINVADDVDAATISLSSSTTANASVLKRISLFESELKKKLQTVVPADGEGYDTKKLSSLPNRIHDCRSYPLYKFVRSELSTQLLSGLRTISPGQDIEKVFDAISEGKLVAPLLQCVQGWTGAPGPFPAQATC
jgi:phenylalanine ammonia-lyase